MNVTITDTHNVTIVLRLQVLHYLRRVVLVVGEGFDEADVAVDFD